MGVPPADRLQDGTDVIDALLQGRDGRRPVGQPRSTPVEANEPAERAHPLEQPHPVGTLPGEVEMQNRSGRPEEVQRTIADDLVGDVDVAALRVLDRGWHGGSPGRSGRPFLGGGRPGRRRNPSTAGGGRMAPAGWGGGRGRLPRYGTRPRRALSRERRSGPARLLQFFPVLSSVRSSDRDLCFTPATALARLYRTHKVSPLEVMEAVL